MRRVLGVLLLLALVGGGCVKLGNIGCSPDNSPRIHVFTAAPDSVEKGKQVMLRWEVSDASSVAIEPGIGMVELIGSKLVTVNATTVFLLTATNRFGKAEKPFSVAVGMSGGVIVDKPPLKGGAPDTVAGGQVAVKPSIEFKSTPSSISDGCTAELSWNVKYATSVSIDQGIGVVAAADKKIVNPTVTTVYTLTAKNNLEETRFPVTVTVSASGSMGGLLVPAVPNHSSEMPQGQN